MIFLQGFHSSLSDNDVLVVLSQDFFFQKKSQDFTEKDVLVALNENALDQAPGLME